MALSSSYDFTITRDDAITEALDMIGKLGEGQSPTAAQLTADSRTLNLMLKSWMNRDFTQNLMRRFYVFLQPGQREYTLSTTAASSDECTTSFYRDELATALVATDTAVEVDGTSSSDSDRIGIVLDDNTVHWSTISSGGGTTSLVIADAIATGDTAAVDNQIIIYTSKNIRPVDIIYGTVSTGATDVGQHNAINETATPLLKLTRERWTDLSAKDSRGQTNSWWYNEQWPNASLHVWPTPNDGTQWLELWEQTTIDDMDGATDNFALPSRWYLAVTLNLAKLLCIKYGAPDVTYQKIKAEAGEALFMAETSEDEAFIQFTPDDRRS